MVLWRTGKLRRMLIAMTLSAVALTGAGTTAAQSDGGGTLDESAIVQVKGKDSAERDAVYERLKLNPDYLYIGKLLAKDPYAIVTSYEANDDQAQAKIKIWTGVFSRSENNLGTFWDDLWVGKSGAITVHATDIFTEIKDYFAADSQKAFQGADYLGKAPWPADVPTDKEALSRHVPSIPADELFNFYQIKFEEPNMLLSPHQQWIKPSSVVPDFSELQGIPSDVAGHWAKDPILHLLRSKIIQGYEDQTVRPNKKLSRAEFVAILTRALKLNIRKDEASAFSDVKGHWSEAETAAAERVGIVPRNSPDGKFQPDRLIERIEMAELIDRAAGAGANDSEKVDTVFRDVSSLSESRKQALKHVYARGLISGYPDGTFKPNESLTRAEAFKVITELLKSMKQ